MALDCITIGKWLARLIGSDKSKSLEYLNDEVKAVGEHGAGFLIKVQGRYYTIAVGRMAEDFKPE